MKRIMMAALVPAFLLAAASWSSAQSIPVAGPLAPQPSLVTGRVYSARPAGDPYGLIDYTDPDGRKNTGIWNYPFLTYGIDYDFDGYYEPPNPYGLIYPYEIPRLAF